MVTTIFQVLLLLQPIAITSNIDMDLFDLIFFRTAVIVLFMASLIDKPKREMPGYINKIVLGLLGLCVFNLFTHNFIAPALANIMNLFLAVMGFYIIYTYLDEKRSLVKFMLWAGAINLIFLIGQRFGFNPAFDNTLQDNNYLAGAFFGNAPRLGTYFALLVPFASFGLLAIATAFFIGQYVIMLPIAVMLYFDDNRMRVVLIGLAVLGGIIFREHILRSVVLRFESYKPALQYFFDRPLLGYGLGLKIDPVFEKMSTSYINFILGFGVLGLVWLGYTFKNIYKKLGRNMESVAFISLALLMAVEYPIELTRIWYIVIAIIFVFVIKAEVII